jgi:hypothetical protein
MLNTKGNQWVIPELGLLNIPEHLERIRDGWAIAAGEESWFQWLDQKHGYNFMDSLRKAASFAVTIGSLPIEEARAWREMYEKGRLTPTGVLGVFYRTGLKQMYLVIVDGQVVEFPYADGRGFGKAATAVDKVMTADTKAFLKKVAVTEAFSWP